MAPSLEDLGAADDRPEVQTLLANLKVALPELEKVLDECSDHWAMRIRSTASITRASRCTRSGIEATRPIVEAFFHARYFLEMAVRYGKELATAPCLLPSGWASLLYLYGLR
jgi:hypothetical protein